MAKIQFDIKYRDKIESGEYKVFAHEHEEQEARIVCWDNKGEYPIVALVDNEPEKFDKHGRVPGGNRGGEFSLFIVTQEEELTKFEKAIDAIYESCGVKELQVKKKATKLLALAREELFANDAVLKEYAEVAREQGKADALKDLPRWKKDNSFETEGTFMGIKGRECFVVKDGYSISVAELIEKLPGFKEDEGHE